MTLRAISGASLLLTLLLAATASQAAMPGTWTDGQPMPSLAPMLEETSPAVVNIATYTTYQVRNPLLEDPFFRRFFNIPNQQRRTRSAAPPPFPGAAPPRPRS